MKILKNCARFARLILHCTAFILAGQVAAQDGPPEIEAISNRGHLIVAMTSFDNPPFYFVDHGHLEGIDVTLAEEIGQALGVEVKFDRTAETFNEVVERVRRERPTLRCPRSAGPSPVLELLHFHDPMSVCITH